MFSIFKKMFNPNRVKQANMGSHRLPIANYIELEKVTKPYITTGELAFYLNLDAKTANDWEMGFGAFRPVSVEENGEMWLRWRLSDVLKYKSKQA